MHFFYFYFMCAVVEAIFLKMKDFFLPKKCGVIKLEISFHNINFLILLIYSKNISLYISNIFFAFYDTL